MIRISVRDNIYHAAFSKNDLMEKVRDIIFKVFGGPEQAAQAIEQYYSSQTKRAANFKTVIILISLLSALFGVSKESIAANPSDYTNRVIPAEQLSDAQSNQLIDILHTVKRLKLMMKQLSWAAEKQRTTGTSVFSALVGKIPQVAKSLDSKLKKYDGGNVRFDYQSFMQYYESNIKPQQHKLEPQADNILSIYKFVTFPEVKNDI